MGTNNDQAKLSSWLNVFGNDFSRLVFPSKLAVRLHVVDACQKRFKRELRSTTVQSIQAVFHKLIICGQVFERHFEKFV